MPRWRRFVALAVAVVAAAGTARAHHADDGRYRMAPFGTAWDTASLDVVILPPTHGQLLNGYGVLNNAQASELDPIANSYVRAIEDSIQAWREGIAAFAPAWLASRVRLDDYVLGRDEVPQRVLGDPEIVITTSPHQGDSIGLTLQGHYGPLPEVRCTISNARLFTQSFGYADMFNVNLHEMGHCLGLDHIEDDHPVHDVMASVYSHTPGTRGTHLHCPANLHVRVMRGAFGELFGRPGPRPVSIDAGRYRTIHCG